MGGPPAASSAPQLVAVEANPPLRTYLRNTWQLLPFSGHLAWYEVATENSRTRFGLGWVILSPMLNAAVYGVIFGLLLGAHRPKNFISFLLIGIFFYDFFSSSLKAGSRTIINNESLIKTISFPRFALAISNVVREVINLGFMLVVLLVFLALLPLRDAAGAWTLANTITVTWLLIIPIVAIYFLFCLGVASLFARLTVHFRDLTSFIPFITRLGMYGSGVIFALENLLQNHPTALSIMQLNPIHAFLALARGAFLSEYQIMTRDWIIVLVSTAIILPVGIWYFWRGEKYYGRSN